jgi:tryptophan-rich sensory protein
LQKIFEKEFPKHCKTKQVVQAWSKILNKKKAIHAYLVEIIIGFIPSNLCTYLMQTSSILHLLYLLWFVLASITKKGGD